MLFNCGWRRLLRVPWIARRSSQSILKGINFEYSLELKLPYFDHLMWRANSLEKTLLLGKIEGRRRRGQQRMRWLDGITNLMGMSLSKLQKMVKDREACHAAVHRSQRVGENWATELNSTESCLTLLLLLESESRSVMSDSLWPYGLQHIRLPCPSLSHGVCSN